MTAEPLTQDPPPCLAVPVANPLPPSLLQTYLDSNYDLRALANQTNIPVPDLLDWLESPQTRRTLERLRDAAADSLALRATEARRTALDALERVVLESEDPIEQRRAATAVLRALNTRPPRNPADPPMSPPNAESQSPNAAPITPRPIPTAPEDVLATALNALSEQSDAPDQALAILHACCAPGATINAEPIAEDPDDFLDDEPDDCRHLLAHVQRITDPPTRTDTTYDQRIAIVRRGGATTRTTFRLEPLPHPPSPAHPQAAGPPKPASSADPNHSTTESPAPWRITAITIDPIDSGFP